MATRGTPPRSVVAWNTPMESGPATFWRSSVSRSYTHFCSISPRCVWSPSELSLKQLFYEKAYKTDKKAIQSLKSSKELDSCWVFIESCSSRPEALNVGFGHHLLSLDVRKDVWERLADDFLLPGMPLSLWQKVICHQKCVAIEKNVDCEHLQKNCILVMCFIPEKGILWTHAVEVTEIPPIRTWPSNKATNHK